MRIAELTVFHVCIPLKKTITHASHSRTETESLIVRCRLTDGTEGWGEGLPRSYVTGETIDEVWERLRDTPWATSYGGDWQPVDWLRQLTTLRPIVLPEDDRGCYGNSVRCAVELSVLDAISRASQQSLSQLIRQFAPAASLFEAKDRTRYSAAFTAMSRWKQISRALKLRYYGFSQSKVKLGVEGVNDRTLLRRLRWILGRQFDLRADVNEAWSCSELERRIQPLLRYGVSSLEQPVPHKEVSQLARFRGKIGLPLMLDESLCSEVDARRAIEQGTCDLFNIRLSKCGGLLASLQLAGQAAEAGLGYQLGCQVGETGILSAAGRHFATSVREIRYLEGSFDRFLVKEPLTQEDLTFGRGGFAPALTGPGLGITIDARALERVTIRQSPFRIS